MLSQLRAAGIEPNLVIVSDHGMTETNLKRVVVLDDHIDRATVQIDSEGSVLALRPLAGAEAAVLRAFEKVPHVQVVRAEDLPPHFKLRNNARISPLWILPEEGWHVVTRATLSRLQTTHGARGFDYLPGDHGYDPALPNMHGILVAHGPAFRRGVQHPAVENIHVYNLLCAVLKLKPARNDGDDRLVKALLRE
jgi:predicted AlkP superfamily pyrophosphatase or phosphodiesterase